MVEIGLGTPSEGHAEIDYIDFQNAPNRPLPFTIRPAVCVKIQVLKLDWQLPQASIQGGYTIRSTRSRKFGFDLGFGSMYGGRRYF